MNPCIVVTFMNFISEESVILTVPNPLTLPLTPKQWTAKYHILHVFTLLKK